MSSDLISPSIGFDSALHRLFVKHDRFARPKLLHLSLEHQLQEFRRSPSVARPDGVVEFQQVCEFLRFGSRQRRGVGLTWLDIRAGDDGPRRHDHDRDASKQLPCLGHISR